MPDHLGSDMRKQKKDVDADDDKPFQGEMWRVSVCTTVLYNCTLQLLMKVISPC